MCAMNNESYDAWKKKCAQEKKERENCTNSLKRSYPFPNEDKHVTCSSTPSTEGTYVTLPTIPPIRIRVDTKNETVMTEERLI